MSKIDDHKSMIVLVFASDSHAVSASTGRYGVMINSNHHHIVVGIEQPVTLRGVLVNVVNISVSWIIFLFLGLRHGRLNKGMLRSLLCQK